MADPYYDQTVLYVPGEADAPALRVPYDYSKYRRPIYELYANTAALSTTVKKNGTASITNLTSTAKNVLYVNPSSELVIGTQDFTIEVWMYQPVAGGQIKTILYQNDGISYVFNFWISSGVGVGTLNFDSKISSAYVNLSTWRHLAVGRSGGFLYLWIDGVSAATPVANSTNYSSTATRYEMYSATPNNGADTCYMDDLRFTVGVNRYTAPFTPPTNILADYTSGAPTFTPRSIPTCSGARIDYKDTYFGSQSLSTAGSISGIVKNGSVPVQRRVRLYESSSGNFVREVWAGLDGTFVFKGLDKNKRFTITSHDHLTGYNDVIAARATPV
jgi:hypothetical protein